MQMPDLNKNQQTSYAWLIFNISFCPSSSLSHCCHCRWWLHKNCTEIYNADFFAQSFSPSFCALILHFTCQRPIYLWLLHIQRERFCEFDAKFCSYEFFGLFYNFSLNMVGHK
jgi:hypothetical protein